MVKCIDTVKENPTKKKTFCKTYVDYFAQSTTNIRPRTFDEEN